MGSADILKVCVGVEIGSSAGSWPQPIHKGPSDIQSST